MHIDGEIFLKFARIENKFYKMLYFDKWCYLYKNDQTV